MIHHLLIQFLAFMPGKKIFMFLLPLVTKELIPLFTTYKRVLKLAGSKVIVSTSESLEIANNKGKLLSIPCNGAGWTCPGFRIVENY